MSNKRITSTGKELPVEAELALSILLDMVEDEGETEGDEMEMPCCERCDVPITEQPGVELGGMLFCQDCAVELARSVVIRFDSALEKRYSKKDRRAWLGRKTNQANLLSEGFKLLPGRRWMAVYSNTRLDLEDEKFKHEGFEQDFIFSRENNEMPELWFYHLPVPHGKATHQIMVGDLAIAVGQFDDTPLADKMIDYYQKNAMKVSHGFLYDPSDFRDNTYQKFHTFEISPLPVGKEANPYTTFNLLEDNSMKVNPDALAELKKILGDDTAEKAVADGQTNALTQIKAIAGYKAGMPPADEETDPKKKPKKDDMAEQEDKGLDGDTVLVAIKGLIEAIGSVSEQQKAAQTSQEQAFGAFADAIKSLHQRIATLEHGPKNAMTPAGQAQSKGFNWQAMLSDLQGGALGGDDKAMGGQPEYLGLIDSLVPGFGK